MIVHSSQIARPPFSERQSLAAARLQFLFTTTADGRLAEMAHPNDDRTEHAYENGEVSAAEREALAREKRDREPEPVGEVID